MGSIYPAFVTETDERPERDTEALSVCDERWKCIFFVQDVVGSSNADYFRIQSIETDYPTRRKGAQDLYGLQTDPTERTNLAAKPERAQRLAEMHKAVLAWWEETGGKAIGALAARDWVQGNHSPNRSNPARQVQQAADRAVEGNHGPPEPQ